MAILLPMFALFLLTLFVMLKLAYLRFVAVKRGDISPGYFRLYQGDQEPESLATYSRHYINLHESPLLFYVISLIIFTANIQSTALLALAWSYVALRYLHSFIHLGTNHVLNRFRVFALSSLVLTVIWALSLIRLLGQM